MNMRWFACLFVLLAACSFLNAPAVNVSDSNESLITGGAVIEVNEPAEPIQRTDVVVEMGGEIVPIQEEFEESNQTEFVEIPKDYTVGEVHTLTPQLEAAVKASPCYEYTWTGFEQYQQKNRLKVDKSVRFTYMGARLFKGWVLSKLIQDKSILDSKSVQVLVNDMQVTCVDEGNFSFDWDKLKK